MKKFMSLRRQEGFTLVELMVVVAIIGLLSAVAVPNFKQYQAKSKVSEAKLQLSALYTAEQGFFSDYNMYAACLSYMGFNPTKEKNSRYYSIGFPAGIAQINTTAHSSAAMSGLSTQGCPADLGPSIGSSWFPAGKSIGAAVIDAVSDAAENIAGTAATCTESESGVGKVSQYGSCVGTQVDAENMVFQAAAVGVISGDHDTNKEASGLNINHNKIINFGNNGY